MNIARHGFRFTWHCGDDRASLVNERTGVTVWRGSLLPVLDLGDAMHRPVVREVREGDGRWTLELGYEGLATARLEVVAEDYGVAFRRLELTWNDGPVALRGLFFGAAELTEHERRAVPEVEATFWPDWKAEGFCVPGAKTNPGQSFWRFWDMGHAVLPLGSFGPAMGTPYTAAFPRPVLAAAMGGPAGWFVFGPGAIPDAAVSLDIKASSAWLRYWMREDLWGAPEGRRRVWEEPLRLSWHEEAWQGLDRLYRSFPVPAETAAASCQHSLWCTWGNFKEGRYDIDHEKVLTATLGAADLQLDDGWETWVGSGVMNEARFPRWKEQWKTMREGGMKVALWQSIGWVDRPEEVGLTAGDLLCGPDGEPRLGHWGCDPRSEQGFHYLLDPASERARDFLITRTRRLVRDYRPALLKLDFGYGMPGPDGVASRNPAMRGERLCFELLRIVATAAREADAAVAIEFYGIHPLFRPLYDVVALDDLGDMGTHEIDGHHQRSVWAALTAAQGVGIMASSGYYWSALDEILLNTAVLGAPGGCQPERDAKGDMMTPRVVSRFRALSRWHRRTVGWEPVWFDSHAGDLGSEPRLHCWGREEGGKLTALALRESMPRPDLRAWGIDSWSGRWAILSLDGGGLDDARAVACIPFDAGALKWTGSFARRRRMEYAEGRETEVELGEGGEISVKDISLLDAVMGFVVERDT